MGYVKNVLISIDQVGNAIGGGNPDCTISGRTGYYQYNAVKPFRLYWKLLAFIIDATFYPLDSHHHCREAYLKEKKAEFSDTKNIVFLFLLSLITLVSCSVLAVIFWTFHGIKHLIKKIKKNAR